MKILEDWFTHREFWEAPELSPHLVGLLDGHKIRTSRIRDVDGRKITTDSGTVYYLGTPSQEFLDWMKEREYPFDPENPIKLVDKPTPMNLKDSK